MIRISLLCLLFPSLCLGQRLTLSVGPSRVGGIPDDRSLVSLATSFSATFQRPKFEIGPVVMFTKWVTSARIQNYPAISYHTEKRLYSDPTLALGVMANGRANAGPGVLFAGGYLGVCWAFNKFRTTQAQVNYYPGKGFEFGAQFGYQYKLAAKAVLSAQLVPRLVTLSTTDQITGGNKSMLFWYNSILIGFSYYL